MLCFGILDLFSEMVGRYLLSVKFSFLVYILVAGLEFSVDIFWAGAWILLWILFAFVFNCVCVCVFFFLAVLEILAHRLALVSILFRWELCIKLVNCYYWWLESLSELYWRRYHVSQRILLFSLLPEMLYFFYTSIPWFPSLSFVFIPNFGRAGSFSLQSESCSSRCSWPSATVFSNFYHKKSWVFIKIRNLTICFYMECCDIRTSKEFLEFLRLRNEDLKKNTITKLEK